MALFSINYATVILASFCFAFIKNVESKEEFSFVDELVLKQGRMDLKIAYLERMLATSDENIANNSQAITDLLKENAELHEYVDLLTSFPSTAGFFEAYKSGHCFKEGEQPYEWSGKLNVTFSGLECQRWSSQYPHEHEYNDVTAFPEDSLWDASNYCRDPSKSGYLWCYTTDENSRYAPCEVTRCETEFDDDTCYRFDERGIDYKGNLDHTLSGYTCQSWSSQYPHEHDFTDSSTYPEGSIYGASNYCRDPENWGRPWCYTTDPDKRWDVCDIAKCAD